MTNPPIPEDPQQPGTPSVPPQNHPQQPASQYAGSQQQYGAPQAPPLITPQVAYYPASVGAPGPGEPYNGATSPEDLSRPLYGATFPQAVRRFFKNYANFSGRASRSEYWWTYLFLSLLSIIPAVLLFIAAIVLAVSAPSGGSGSPSIPANDAGMGTGVFLLFTAGAVFLVLILGTIVPYLAISWRRLHDANFAGPMYFLSLIPSVGPIVLLVFMILSSNPEGVASTATNTRSTQGGPGQNHRPGPPCFGSHSASRGSSPPSRSSRSRRRSECRCTCRDQYRPRSQPSPRSRRP
ncbi:DUF805 domain-containing protein [Leucobacter insecticola]|uniref:DUF805 domain-containing protein n=1 Tax=Leucobacter insecticola TaxID=2714934 RepID=A0A6G8FI04_9MICO|nr:DUF805 domain-containing protein [Leucobacter insecticola]